MGWICAAMLWMSMLLHCLSLIPHIAQWGVVVHLEDINEKSEQLASHIRSALLSENRRHLFVAAVILLTMMLWKIWPKFPNTKLIFRGFLQKCSKEFKNEFIDEFYKEFFQESTINFCWKPSRKSCRNSFKNHTSCSLFFQDGILVHFGFSE